MIEILETPLSEILAPLIADYAGAFTGFASIDAQAADAMNTICDEYSNAWNFHKFAMEKAKAAIDALIPADCESMVIETLAGKLAIRRSSALEIADEAVTVEKLKTLTVQAQARISGWQRAAIAALNLRQPEEKVEASLFLHVKETPNKEALEKLDDAMLAFLGVQRVTRVSWTFTPRKMKAPKAAKAGEKDGAKNEETGGADDAK